MPKHLAIYISNKENKKQLHKDIASGAIIPELSKLKGSFFTEFTLNKCIQEEVIHDNFNIETETSNSLLNSSEGERKRALLKHILSDNRIDYLVLDNVFDCLDIETQANVEILLKQLSKTVRIIQVAARKRDILPFIDTVYVVKNKNIKAINI